MAWLRTLLAGARSALRGLGRHWGRGLDDVSRGMGGMVERQGDLRDGRAWPRGVQEDDDVGWHVARPHDGEAEEERRAR